MRKSELTFDIVGVLKDYSSRLTSELRGILEAKIPERERRLLEHVFAKYYQQDKILGRWYDPCHILFSGLVAARLTPLAVPAIILHDIGYLAIPDKDTGWNTVHSQIVHMQEGAAMTARNLVEAGGYSAQDIEIIVGMVASHDNQKLGIPVSNPLRLALMDADRAWAMHFISFWKDFASDARFLGSFSLVDLLEIRREQFYGKDKPYTDSVRRLRNRQFKDRFREVENDIAKDEETFRAHVRACL